MEDSAVIVSTMSVLFTLFFFVTFFLFFQATVNKIELRKYLDKHDHKYINAEEKIQPVKSRERCKKKKKK